MNESTRCPPLQQRRRRMIPRLVLFLLHGDQFHLGLTALGLAFAQALLELLEFVAVLIALLGNLLHVRGDGLVAQLKCLQLLPEAIRVLCTPYTPSMPYHTITTP